MQGYCDNCGGRFTSDGPHRCRPIGDQVAALTVAVKYILQQLQYDYWQEGAQEAANEARGYLEAIERAEKGGS